MPASDHGCVCVCVLVCARTGATGGDQWCDTLQESRLRVRIGEPVMMAAVITAKVPWKVMNSDSGILSFSVLTMPWSQILFGPPTIGLPGSNDIE